MTNREYWEAYGDKVFMAMPYADEVLTGGRGCRVTDADGRELLDLASGMFCCVLGHNHPKFMAALSRQMSELVHSGTQFVSPAVLVASDKLARVAPGRLQKSIILSTGTEANEFAFRVAKAYTGRTGIVGLSRGYYGTSLATRSCSGLFSYELRDNLPLVCDTARVPIGRECVSCFTAGNGASCDYRCLENASEWISNWSNVAAVIVEPILSAGGMLFPPTGYLQRLRDIAHQNGALFIVDEAQTGFGRTGKWFAIEHHNIEPDILTMSKSIGNGFPAAAVITTAEIADQVVDDGLWNLSSHQSDPLAAAAISAVIDVVEEEKLTERAAENGRYFLAGLVKLSQRQPLISNPRGQGLMIGFDFIVPEGQGLEAVNHFMFSCRRHGVHLTYGYGSVSFRIIPPLVITKQDIDFALEVMENVAESVVAGRISKACWPSNQQTRRLYNENNWKRYLRAWWRSSPERWVEKGRALFASKAAM